MVLVICSSGSCVGSFAFWLFWSFYFWNLWFGWIKCPSLKTKAVSRAQVLAFLLLRLTCVNGATCSSLQAYVPKKHEEHVRHCETCFNLLQCHVCSARPYQGRNHWIISQSQVDWVGQWKTTCQPANPVPSANFSWFSSCSWIDCECLWGALAAPVATDELAPCFEEALLKSLLDQDSLLQDPSL